MGGKKECACERGPSDLKPAELGPASECGQCASPPGCPQCPEEEPEQGQLRSVFKAARGAQITHPEVGAEDMGVAAGHLQDAPDALTEQLRRVHVLQDGLEAAHHQLR